MSDLVTQSSSSLEVWEYSRHKRPSKIRWSKAKRRMAVYTGVTLLGGITGFIWLYSYAVSVLDSALSVFKP
jgi:hypothetical protein